MKHETYKQRELNKFQGVLERLTKQAADPMPIPARFLEEGKQQATPELLKAYREKILKPWIEKTKARVDQIKLDLGIGTAETVV